MQTRTGDATKKPARQKSRCGHAAAQQRADMRARVRETRALGRTDEAALAGVVVAVRCRAHGILLYLVPVYRNVPAHRAAAVTLDTKGRLAREGRTRAAATARDCDRQRARSQARGRASAGGTPRPYARAPVHWESTHPFLERRANPPMNSMHPQVAALPADKRSSGQRRTRRDPGQGGLAQDCAPPRARGPHSARPPTTPPRCYAAAPPRRAR